METKYIPLYRKYRPQTFHDLIGQENIVISLSKAIELNRIAHAFLLCGPRGTGKTSSARILAKSLNCKEGPTLTPCGKCPACLDIMNSIPVDVIEIDAASNRSVEDTQAILEKIQYVPVNGRYKIYIIDEVHMLSTTAFNSLLKTLEEPPENVIFILATTEPQKVLETIISRCQRYDFRRITIDDIVKRLKYISEQENINIADEALFAIAKNSQGGMRDSLALLDQISVLGTNKQIIVDDINEILGKISFEVLSEITQCIIDSDCSKSVPLIDKIYSKGNEPVQIIANLIQHFRDLMLIKNCTDRELLYSLLQISEANYQKAKEQAEVFSVSEVVQIIDKLSYYSNQIKTATNKYMWLELCIIDLTNYKNLPSVDNLLRRIEELEQMVSGGNYTPAPRPMPVAQPKPQVQVQPKPVQIEQKVEEMPIEQPKVELQKEVAQVVEQEKPVQQAPVSQPIAPAPVDDLHALWASLLQSIDSPPNRAFYTNLARPVEISNEKIVIAFKKDLFVKQAKEGAKKQSFVDAVKSYMNISNPNIDFIVSEDIDLVKKVNVAPVAIKKAQEQKDIREKEEEEYQNFIESKKEEEKKPIVVDSSSQAGMVKELFNGKYVE